MKQVNWDFINTLLLIGIYIAGFYVYQKIQNVEQQVSGVTQPAENILKQLGLG